MPVGSFVGGVIIALCTTCLSALGLALQKLAHSRRLRVAAALRRTPVTRSPLFLAGIACMVVSALVSLAVIALVGQAVASSFAAVTIVWSLIFSSALLHERVTVLDVLCALVLAAGAVLVVVFGRQGGSHDPKLSPKLVRRLFTREAVLVFAPLAAFAIFVCAAGARLLSSGAGATLARLRGSALLALAAAGLCSGATGSASRGLVGLVAFALQHGRGAEVAASAAVWLFALSLPVCLLGQVSALNLALRLRPSNEVVPAYQASIVLLGAVFGVVLFEEGSGLNVGGFAGGVGVILFGLALLSLKRAPPPPPAVALSDALDAFLAAHDPEAQLRRTTSAPAALRPAVRTARAGGASGAGEACEAREAGEAGVVLLVRRSSAVTPRRVLVPPAGAHLLFRNARVPAEGRDAERHRDETLAAAPAVRCDVDVAALLVEDAAGARTQPAFSRRARATLAAAAFAKIVGGVGGAGSASGAGDAGAASARSSRSRSGPRGGTRRLSAEDVDLRGPEGRGARHRSWVGSKGAASATAPLPLARGTLLACDDAHATDRPAAPLRAAVAVPAAIVRNVSLSPRLLGAALRADSLAAAPASARAGPGPGLGARVLALLNFELSVPWLTRPNTAS